MIQQRRNRGCILSDRGWDKLQDTLKNFDTKPSIEKLAELANLSTDTVSKILRREEGVDKRSIQELFTALGLKLEQTDHIPAPKETTLKLDPNFLGREGAIAHLKNLIQQGAKAIVIHGKGGIGKTTLAWQFLHTQGFDKILDLRMAKETQNITSAESVIEEWLRRYFDEEPGREFGITLDRLRQHLRNPNQRIGILIDNLEPALDQNGRCIEAHRKYVELFTALADPAVQSVTLITSRECLREAAVTVENYRLQGLDIAAWEEFFNSRNIQIDTEVLNAMHQAYGGNAKAMRIFPDPIKEFNNNLAAYWQANKDDLLIERELEGLVVSQFNRLQQLDSSAYKLLCRLGCYRYQDVPRVPENDSKKGLSCLLWDVPNNQHRRIIKSLQDRSLVEFCNQEYWLHPVIRTEAIKRLRESEDRETANSQAIEFLVKCQLESDNNKKVQVMNPLNESSRLNCPVYLIEAFYQAYSTEDWERAFQIATDEGLLDKLDSRSLPVRSIDICNLLLNNAPATSSQNSNSLVRRTKVTQYLGHACLDLGDLKKSENAYQEWLDLSEATGDLKEKAHALSNIGLIYHNRANYSLSLEYHNSAFEIIQEINEDKWGEAFIVGNIGLVYKSLENYQSAIKYLAQSVKLNKKILNWQWCSYPLSSLGYVYGCLNFFNKAIKLQEKALNISKQQNDDWGKLLALQNLASTYNRMNDAERAIDTITEAKKILNHHGDRRGSTIIQGILGGSYKLKKEYNLACDNLSNALADMNKIGLIDGQVDFLLEIGEVYTLLKSYDLAIESINRAKKIAVTAKIEGAISRCNSAKQKIIRI